MASGVECAGLALAVLPLFIEVAKVYSDGVESILDVTIKSRWDERLEDFYFDFYMQLFYLNDSMQRIRNFLALHDPSTGNTQQSTEVLTRWNHDPGWEKSLRRYFGSDDRFNAFTIISKKILLLLQQLLKDKPNRMSSKDQVSVLYRSQQYIVVIVANLDEQ